MVAALSLGAACTSSQLEQPSDESALVHHWHEAPDEETRDLARALNERELFRDVTEAVEERIVLPNNLPVHHTDCDGRQNTYWRGRKEGIVLCYEYLTKIWRTLRKDRGLSEREVLERAAATWTFFFFHELGHALIDLYDLPVVGREEDAVDDFSTLLLLEVDRGQLAARAADYWRATSWEYDAEDFADEHSLGAQRFYGILCTVYGSDPERFSSMVDEDLLPRSQATSCTKQYQLKRRSWERLLERWLW